ncbi:hypothetical protein AB4Y77_05860 [Paenarthrobacter sp. YAF11_1]|uniref:hypothetical protein n=1 Tax=Paenarthrobacter sp. YAF11_1 TaxID=3233074 RepID=UPI003F9E1A96
MGELGTDIPLGETRDVSTELARLMIERAAPDELLTFDEVADEYYADPESTLNPAKNDEAVGFGLELALLAPFALAVAQFIIGFLGDLLRDVAKDAVKDAAKPAVTGAVRRVLRLGSPQDSTSAAIELTAEQRDRVFAAAKEQSKRLGLDETKADLLGNAILGVLSR